MHEIIERIKQIGVIPVIVIDSIDSAEQLARALINGGVPCAEITFRTDAAQESMRIIKRVAPEILLLAGTVLCVEQADLALLAGAAGVISPGLNPVIAKHCIEKGITYIPGVATPSEMEAAMGMGLYTVKFFPAVQAGGADYIKAVSAPYNKLTFIPTGGITTDNLRTFLRIPSVLACGASYLAERQIIRESNFSEITRRCIETRAIVTSLRS